MLAKRISCVRVSASPHVGRFNCGGTRRVAAAQGRSEDARGIFCVPAALRLCAAPPATSAGEVSPTFSPSRGTAVLVQDASHLEKTLAKAVIDRVWEVAKQNPSQASVDHGTSLRHLAEKAQGCVEVRPEVVTEPGALLLVPRKCPHHVGGGFGAER